MILNMKISLNGDSGGLNFKIDKFKPPESPFNDKIKKVNIYGNRFENK